MSLLLKQYEISYWEDVWDESQKAYIEKRMFVIGASGMETQSRALEPKLVRKTNGEVNFTFKMFYTYNDVLTGEKVNNPFTPFLKNETKIKLNYAGEWFDLLIKNIVEDSTNKSYTYQLVDQHMNELSKNGFNVVLNTELNNNLGTIEKLGTEVMSGTDWGVESEKIVQTLEETLVMLNMPLISHEDWENYDIYQIQDTHKEEGLTTIKLTEDTVPKKSELAGKLVYAFYSSCSGKPYRFQFFFKKSQEYNNNNQPVNVYDKFSKDSNRIITDTQCQYYIDGLTYLNTTNSQGVYIPKGWSVDTHENNSSIGNASIFSVLYRGNRYVYAEENEFHAGLNKYVQKFNYEENGIVKECYGYKKTTYIAPTILQNFVTNPDFKTTSGWRGSKFCTTNFSDSAHSATIEACALRKDPINGYTTSIQDTYDTVDIQSKTYESVLMCGNLKYIWGTDIEDERNKCLQIGTIINSGPNDFAKNFGNINKGEKYIVKMYFDYVGKTQNDKYYSHLDLTAGNGGAVVDFRVANYRIDSTLNGYDHNKFNYPGSAFIPENGAANLFIGQSSLEQLEWDAEKSCYVFYKVVQARESLSAEQYINDKYNIFLEFPTATQINSYIIIKDLQFYRAIPKEAGGYYSPEDDISIDNLTYNEEWKYFSIVQQDLRKEEEITFLPDGLEVTPILSADGSKQTQVNIKESNYYNAIQTLAEAFQSWPSFETNHDLNGNLIPYPNKTYSKKIKFRNYVGSPNNVGFHYGINTKNIKRTIDSKQIVSKLIVKPNNNEFAPNGFCTIQRATANSKKDNVLYDFGYYINQGLLKDALALQQDLYIADPQPEKVAEADLEAYYTSADGYYTKIGYINNQLENIGLRLSQYSPLLAQEQTTYNVAHAGYEAANEELTTYIDNFYSIAGFDYNNLPGTNLIKNSDETIIGDGNYLVKHYQWIDEPSSYDMIECDIGNDSFKMRPGKKYSIRLDVTPAAGVNYLGLHTNWGYKGLGSSKTPCWAPVIPGQRQIVFWTFEAPSEDYEYNKGSTCIDIFQREDLSDQGVSKAIGTTFYNIVVTRGECPSRYYEQDGEDVIKNSTTLTSYLTKITQLTQEKDSYLTQYQTAEENINKYNGIFEELIQQQEEWTERKKALELAFYSRYARFIQEGTWMDESYMDDNLYYLAAQSVLYNSSKPKVSYNIDVISLAGIPGYELFDFKIGNQTFIEDVEFFGYEANGTTPYKEKITITETVENLDDPLKNTIRVQNYENQFQDLFQRITATVQSTQYAEGSYDRAVALAEADEHYKLRFLNDVLNSADLHIQDRGNNVDITNDGRGIIINNIAKGTQIRLIGNGIYLSNEKNEQEEPIWKAGITADGISASLITSGRVDTGAIQIMNGDEPTFRWDTHGITAYDFDNSQSNTYVSDINVNKGVRFDRFGIYGYSGINGETWKPQSISNNNDSTPNINSYSTFSLTWEGLKVTAEQSNSVAAYSRKMRTPAGGATLHIGNGAKTASIDDYILRVTRPTGIDGDNETTFAITMNGDIYWGGDNEPFNRDKLLGVLDTLDSENLEDGIYNDGQGNIGINATAIKAGSINIGGSKVNDYLDAQFYADVDNHTVSIGGWYVGGLPQNWLEQTYPITNALYTHSGSSIAPQNGDCITLLSSTKNLNPELQDLEAWSLANITRLKDGKKHEINYLLTNKGTFIANKAKIKGDVTITSGSIKLGSRDDGAYNFEVDPSGNVRVNGNITWSESNEPFNRSKLLEQLTQGDGIYQDGNGNIAINASMILAGELQVGGTPGEPDSDGVKFYASKEDDEVRIGGWNVSDNALKNQDFGLYKDGGQHPLNNELIIMKSAEEATHQIFGGTWYDTRRVYEQPHEIGTTESKQYTFQYDYSKINNFKLDEWDPEWFDFGGLDNGYVQNLSVKQVGSTLLVNFTVSTIDDGFPYAFDWFAFTFAYSYTIPDTTYKIPRFAMTVNGDILATSGLLGQWEFASSGLYSAMRKIQSGIESEDIEYIRYRLTSGGLQKLGYKSSGMNIEEGSVIAEKTWDSILKI